MGNFLRSRHPMTNESSFVQGAARLFVAPSSQTEPNGAEDFMVLMAGATQFDAVSGWIDAGFTKTGINITRNNAEEDFTVDQIRGSIMRRPSSWEMSVGTQLAEATMETFNLAWELSENPDGTPNISPVTKTTPQLDENQQGLGAPVSYHERKVVVAYQFPSGLIRYWYFGRCYHAAQESGFTLNSTGEQVSLPVRFNCLPDTSKPVESQFGFMAEQVAAP